MAIAYRYIMAYEIRVCIGVWLLLLYESSSICSRALMKDGKVHIEGKIVGGVQVSIERFPYAVQLFNLGSLCGGAILSSWSVLTAAHCFDLNKDIDDMELHIGSRYTLDFAADRYNVFYFVQHEDYNKSMQFACDIALIFVSRPITFSTKTSKARLVNSDKWMFLRESNFTTTGWGRTEYDGKISNVGLLMTNLEFVSADRCSEMNNIRLTPDMFCLYGDRIRDSCKGDSGGGVEWNGMIVGVVSYGQKGGCAVKDKPSVYANVWYFRGWIKDQMNFFIKVFCKKKTTARTGDTNSIGAKNIETLAYFLVVTK